MNESGVTRDLLVRLRADPHIITDKHADRFTSGIPDISVIGPGDYTTWLELKNLKNDETLISFLKRERVGKLQLHKMCRIGFYTRAFYAVYRSNSLEIRFPWQVLDDFQRDVETPANIVDQVPLGNDPQQLASLLNAYAPIRFMGKSLHHIVHLLCYMKERPHGPVPKSSSGVSRENRGDGSGDIRTS